MRPVQPVLEKHTNDRLVESTERHPAYGMVGASRVTANPGAFLHGSDFRHHNYIVVRVQHGEMHRTLSHDWPSTTSEPVIVELALSEAQWAAFVSTLNMGEGVPCTLERVGGKELPGIDRTVDRRAQFRSEMERQLRVAESRIDELLAAFRDGRLRGIPKDQLQFILYDIKNNLSPNIEFTAKSFDEHMDRTTSAAKSEVTAYVQAAVTRAGLQALGAPPPLELEEEVDDEGAV